ncbi:MAG TPA: glycosyltransferase family 4 protein [Gaiellales bacterium]|jgi:glycosyltransferase involved in cell wall biosynthesis|nr:glycosyltransferase family 4 protein [Gaiellales bacterium]
MRLVIWHGYLLDGTGSNVYTREVAKAWTALGHDVRVICAEPRPEQAAPAGVRVIRPDIGPLLPTFLVDDYEGVTARPVGAMSEAELGRYLDANVQGLREQLAREPAAAVLANHAIMGGPVANAGCVPSGTPYGIKLHGSELEYAIRGEPRLAAMARPGVDGAAAVFAGSQHIVDVAGELLGDGPYRDRLSIVPPGVDTHGFRPDGGSLAEACRLLDADPQAGRSERAPDVGVGARLAGLGRFVLYVGKLIPEKGVDILLEAWREAGRRHPEVTLVVVGFGPQRAALEAAAPARTVFTGAMDHRQLQCLVPLAETVVVPSQLAEAFGMIAAEAAACGVPPVVAGHSGLAEVAAALGDAAVAVGGGARDYAAALDRVLELPPARRRRLSASARRVAVEHWSWQGVGRRLIDAMLAPA